VRNDDYLRPDVSSRALMPRSPGNRAVRSAKSLTQKVARLERAKPKPAKPKRAKPKRAKPQHAARKKVAPVTLFQHGAADQPANRALLLADAEWLEDFNNA